MKAPFLHLAQSAAIVGGDQAIILLPDIFIATDYAAATAKTLADKFGQPVFWLDYFYQLTGEPNAFSAADSARPFELLQQLKGDDFASLFHQSVETIRSEQPQLTTINVVGFCFGGRLAYITGLEPLVKNIVSFYGASAHQPNYVHGKTPIEALITARANDKSLKVLSFYGTDDSTIPAADRQATQEAFQSAGIDYAAREYKAGHAYFQPGRDNYDAPAAARSWHDLEEFFSAS